MRFEVSSALLSSGFHSSSLVPSLLSLDFLTAHGFSYFRCLIAFAFDFCIEASVRHVPIIPFSLSLKRCIFIIVQVLERAPRRPLAGPPPVLLVAVVLGWDLGPKLLRPLVQREQRQCLARYVTWRTSRLIEDNCTTPVYDHYINHKCFSS